MAGATAHNAICSKRLAGLNVICASFTRDSASPVRTKRKTSSWSERSPLSNLLLYVCIIGLHPCSKAGCNWDEECQVDETGMPQCLCPGPCPPIHRPVCGSDQRTYSSTCDLLRESCLQKRNITLIYEGICGRFCVVDPVARTPSSLTSHGCRHTMMYSTCLLVFQDRLKPVGTFSAPSAATALKTQPVIHHVTVRLVVANGILSAALME